MAIDDCLIPVPEDEPTDTPELRAQFAEIWERITGAEAEGVSHA